MRWYINKTPVQQLVVDCGLRCFLASQLESSTAMTWNLDSCISVDNLYKKIQLAAYNIFMKPLRKYLLLMVALFFLYCSSVSSEEYMAIKKLIDNGGTGQFNCAYKGKKTKNPCSVSVNKELVTHPDFVNWHGKAADVNVIRIKWPDGDISRYTWSDSGEMLNLIEKNAWGYKLAGDEVDQDWSLGFLILKDGIEYIRIW